MAENYQDWPDKLSFALWADRTWIQSSTKVTPYSLVYKIEAILPIEIAMSSLRVITESQILELEWARAQHEELVMIDERRLQALHNV